MDQSYNISQLFQAAFGFNIPGPIHTNVSDYAVNFSGVEVLESEEEVERLSQFGTPILFPVTFQGGPYMRYKKNGELENKEMPDFDLPAATLVDFSKPKKMVETDILTGGSVKEIFGVGDWSIHIRGLCLSDSSRKTHKKAAEQINQLRLWEGLTDSISVYGKLFERKDIFNLVIKKINFPALEGTPDAFPFELECISDSPLEWEELDNKLVLK